ncbi:hypothetical protein [Lysinibacillus xylanilyticus]|uniref:hypothetical protein n=1 Tax=Lysinibacillus xylanilyticus TaxID=582475 RepID=UPI0036DFA3BF
MDLLNSIKFVLFTFPDGTHFVVRTSLNTDLVPEMEEGCVFDLDRGVNIPLLELEETERVILEEYPEAYREESEFYAQLRYGVAKVFRTED